MKLPNFYHKTDLKTKLEKQLPSQFRIVPKYLLHLLFLSFFLAYTVTLDAQIIDLSVISTPIDAAAHDEYGSAVAVTETMTIIGAPNDENQTGSVYVRALDGNNWIDKQKVVADDGGTTGDLFGSAIAAFGDWVIVGAPGNNNATGKAYIYKKNGDFLIFQQAIVPSNGDNGFNFGISVAINDTIAVIGANGENANGSAAGAAYIFTWNGTNWAEANKLLASDGITSDEFGASVAISDSLIVVGARYKEFFQMGMPVSPQAGAAYVFHYDEGNWSEMDKITASDGMGYDYFGHSVGINLNPATGVASIAIGAYGADATALHGGAMYYYTYNGTAWIESKFVPSDLSAGDNFGWSIAMSGSLVVAGCPEQNNGAGALYVLAPNGSGALTQMSKLTDALPNNLDHYGYSVGVTNGIVVTGAYHNDTRAVNGGSISLYELIAQNASTSASDGLFEDKIRVTWQDRSSIESAFNIYRDGVFLASVGANVLVYEDFTAVLGETYEYCVTAYNATWGESPLTCDIGYVGAVNAPADLIASYDTHEDYIKLEWTNLSSTADGIYVFKNDGVIDTLPASQQTYSDFEVLSPLDYDYCLVAFDLYMDTFIDSTHAVITLDGTNGIIDSSDLRTFAGEAVIDEVVDTIWGQSYYLMDSLPNHFTAAQIALLNNWAIDTIDLLTANFDTLGHFIESLTYVTETFVTERELQSGPICEVGRALLPSPTLDVVSYRAYEDSVEVIWTNHAVMTDGYQVYRDGFLIAVLDDPAQVSYVDFDAVSGSFHTYCVTAYRELDFEVENILSTPVTDTIFLTSGDTAYIEVDSFYTVIDTVTMISESIREDGTNCGEGGVLMNSPHGLVATDGDFETMINLTWIDSSVVNEKYKLYKDGVLLEVMADVNGSTLNTPFTYSDPNVVAEQKYHYCLEAYHPTLGASTQVCDSGYIEIHNPNYNECASAPELAIAGNGTVVSDIITNSGSAPSLGTSTEIEGVCLLLEHPDLSDLKIKLIAPNGSVIHLSNQQGDFVANYGNVLKNQELCFTTDAIHTLNNYTGGKAGDWQPEEAFAGLDGINPNGNWTLEITNMTGNHLGILHSWRIRFSDGNCDRGFIASNGTAEDRVTLNWKDESSVNDGYKIFRDGVEIKNLTDGNITTFIDDINITSLERYNYCVQAYSNTFGNSLKACDIGWTALRAPQTLTATDANANNVVLTWVDVSEFNEGYIIFRDGVELEDIADTGPVASTFTYTDPQPADFAIHNYCVQAYHSTLGKSKMTCDEGSKLKPPVPIDSVALTGNFEEVVLDTKLPNPTTTNDSHFGYSLAVENSEVLVAAAGVFTTYSMVRELGIWVTDPICSGGGGHSLALDDAKAFMGESYSTNGYAEYTRKLSGNWQACSSTALAGGGGLAVAVHGNLAAAVVIDNQYYYNTQDNSCTDLDFYENGLSIRENCGSFTNDPLVVNMDIPLDENVNDLKLKTFIRYAYNEDIEIILQAPNGSQALVVSGELSDGQNAYLDTEWFDASINDISDVSNVTSCEEGNYPDFKPQAPFSIFNGNSTQGTWNLIIKDISGSFLCRKGGLERWELTFGTNTYVKDYTRGGGIVVFEDNGSSWDITEEGRVQVATKASHFGNQFTQAGIPFDLTNRANQSLAMGDGIIALGVHDANSSSEGNVFIYNDLGGIEKWNVVDTIPAPTGSVDFGWSVFIEDDLLLISDISKGDGIVYGYTIVNNNVTGGPIFALTPPTTSTESQFGKSIDKEGDKLLIGAAGSSTSPGAAYQYLLIGNTWQPFKKYTASDGANGDKFGYTVALEGNLVVIGAPNHDGFGMDRGAVYSQLNLNGVIASDGEYNNRVKIEWAFEPDALANEFYVYRDTTKIVTLASESEVYYDYDALPGTVYDYTVVANVNGDLFSEKDKGFVRSNGKINGTVSNSAGGGVPDVRVCASADGIHHALEFDGVNDIITLDGNIPLQNSDFTIECWAKRNGASSVHKLLFSLGNNPANNELLHMGFEPSNKFMFSFHGNDLITDGAYTDTDWHHWAVTYEKDNAGTLKIYHNGILVKTGTGQGPFIGNENSLLLGGYLPVIFFNFDGYIDDFRIWNVARSQAEIERTKNQMLVGDEAGLIAYYPLNEGEGFVVGDFAKNGNHHGTLNAPCWTYEVPDLDYCDYTDGNGFYEILNVFYKESTEMTVSPYLEKHGFSPDKHIRELSNINPTATSVNFLDTTGFVIEGNILTSVYNTSIGPVSCPVENIEIWYNQEAFDTTFVNSQVKTAADGSYSLAITNPGEYVIQPRLSAIGEANTPDSTSIAQGTPDTTNTATNLVNTHVFDPPTQTLIVNDNKQNIDFTDITNRTIVVKVTGACNSDLGTSKVSITSEGGCIPLLLETNGLSYFETPPLPPLSYNLRVTDVRDNGQINVGAINYFESRVQQVDLSETKDTVEFVFNRPFKLTVDNLPSRETCLPTPPGFVLRQGESHTLVMEVFQEFPDGTFCPADTGELHIVDNVSGIGAVTVPFSNGLAFYTLTPTEPEVVAPHLKSFTAVAEVDGALTSVQSFDVLVTGAKPRTATFVTLIDHLPLFVLRDPPGDNSFSSLETGKSICIETGFSASSSLSAFGEFGLVPSIGDAVTGTIAIGGEITIEAGVSSELDLLIRPCITATQTFSTSDSPVLVGKNGDVFVGLGANFIYALTDIISYHGCKVARDTTLAMQPTSIPTNYTYTNYHIESTLLPALEVIKSLHINSGNGEEARKTQSAIDNWTQAIGVNESIKNLLLNDDKKIATGDLKASLIPLHQEVKEDLESIAVEDANGILNLYEVSESQLSGSIINFDQFALRVNFPLAVDGLGTALPWPEVQNYSFSAGAPLSQSVSVSKAWSVNIKAEVFLEGSVALLIHRTQKAGIVVGGFEVPTAGGEGTVKVGAKFNLHIGGVFNNTREVNTEISYTLADDDLGDYFSVDVVGDPIYGTPVFKIRSGASSCPWEEGTQRRDALDLEIVGTDTQLNLPEDEAAGFMLKLFNRNEAGEPREFSLRTVTESNIHNASVTSNGDIIANGAASSFWIYPNNPFTVNIDIIRGPNHYDYTQDSIGVMMYPSCEYVIWSDGGNIENADTAWFKILWTSPCSEVNVFSPQDNWLINNATGDNLPIVLTDYDVNAGNFQHLRIDYREVSPQNISLPDGGWINLTILDAPILNSVPDPFYTYNWNTSSLGDGQYEVKAVSVCQTPTGSATNSSWRIPGTIDRNSFLLLGTPQPADGTLNAGEDITVTFNEMIACDTFAFGSNIHIMDLSTATELTYDSSADLLGEFNVVCSANGEELLIDLIDLAAYEGHLLQVIIDTQEDIDNFIYPLTDLGGNKLYEPITWTFIVQQNEVFWNPPDLTYTLYQGDVQTTTVQLNNISTGTKAFQLDYSALPAWINVGAVPSTNLSPNGYQDITLHFNLLNTLTAGNIYTDAVTAWIDENPLLDSSGDGIPNNDQDYAQMLPITIQVLAAPPAWNINPASFAYSMNMIAELNINSDISNDDLDMLSAYVDGELRGFANVEYFAPIDKHLAFLTIYNHNETGDSVTFRAWDASDGVLYGARRFNFNGDADISFVHQSTIGSLGIPETMYAGFENVQCIDLENGWNLVSLNVTATDMSINTLLAGLNPTTGDIVKTQAGDISIYDDLVGAWVGTADSLNNSEAFYVQLANSSQLCVTGTAVDLAMENLPLLTGWNGVAYPSQTTSTVDAALANLSAADGDLISHPYNNEFAQYDAGSSSWIGSLGSLEAGEGYILKVANPTTFAFAESNALGWQYEARDFQYSMNVIGVIEIDALPSFDADDQVGAFINGESRGYAESIFVDEYNRHFFLLTVFSNDNTLNEAVEFRVYDASADTIYTAASSMNFNTDMVTGNLSNPYNFAVYTCGDVALTTTPESCTAAFDGTATALASMVCGAWDSPCLSPSDYDIGVGNTASNFDVSPYSGYYADARFDYLYTAQELRAAGLTEGTISGLAFNVLTKSSVQPYTNFTIKMKCTDATELTSGNFTIGTKLVYSGNYTTQNGWNEHPFTTNYDWDGISNLVVQICFDNATYTNDDIVAATTTNYTSAIGFYDDSGSGCGFAAGLLAFNKRPDIRFSSCATNFVWDDGQTTATAVGLTAGLHTVDITLPNSCQITASVIVGATSDLTLAAEQIAGTCGAFSQGVAGVTPIGGIAPYTYNWSNGSQNETAAGLDAGTYSVTVTDANNCIQTAQVTINTLANSACLVVADIRLFLEGPYVTNHTMTTALNNYGLLPLTQPYNVAPWNYGGNESVVSMPANATDWILVEARNVQDIGEVLASKAALLLKNGYVQNADGSAGVKFDNLAPGEYYITIRHRNHLAVISAIPLNLPNTNTYDFTQSAAQAMGANQQTGLETGVYGLYAGDLNSDGVVTITDFNYYQSEASMVNQYLDADCNLNRAVTVADFNLYQPNASIIGISPIRY